MTVVCEIRKFGETTSIRGLPRALKTEDKPIAFVWWSAVVIFSTVLVSQLTLLLIRYYKYEYTTTSHQGTSKPVSDRSRVRKIRLNNVHLFVSVRSVARASSKFTS